MNDELVWDNGTPFPEPCIDRLAPHIGKVLRDLIKHVVRCGVTCVWTVSDLAV